MPKVIYFADVSNGRPGRGATIRLDSGEPCLISIAQTGILVKKSRYGLMGPVLYSEKNIYKAAATAKALSEQYPHSLLPPGFTDPVLSAVANAVLHCSTAAEVAITLNQALDISPPATTTPRAEDGATPEDAIHIHATNSVEGIPKEYAVLTTMFGKPNQDWKLIDRRVIHTNAGRKIEKFIVSASNKRKEVYFDITDWFDGNTSPEAKSSFAKLIAPYERPVTVLLPKNEFTTLERGLSQLTDAQLKQLGLSADDRQCMLDPLLDTMKQWDRKGHASVPKHVSVTMLMSAWSNVKGLLASWQPADLLQEEELENLKAIIGGAMNAVRAAPIADARSVPSDEILALFRSATAWELVQHESRRWIDELMLDSKDPVAPQTLRENAAAVRRYLHVDDDGLLKRSDHQKFAQRFECYLLENTAPTRTLGRVFAVLKEWLITVYKIADKFNIPITSDVRDWYARALTLGDPEKVVIMPDRPARR